MDQQKKCIKGVHTDKGIVLRGITPTMHQQKKGFLGFIKIVFRVTNKETVY